MTFPTEAGVYNAAHREVAWQKRSIAAILVFVLLVIAASIRIADQWEKAALEVRRYVQAVTYMTLTGDELYKYLKAMPNRIQSSGQDNHVFLYRGKPLKTIRNGLTALCKKAGIKYGRFKKGGFIFHDLRHTFNTNMRKAGVQESVIMEITGHSTREMFDRYNTIDDEDAQKAVNQLEVFLAKGPHSGPQNHGRKSVIKKTAIKTASNGDLK